VLPLPFTISRLESGDAQHAYARTVRDLARALGVSADYLLGLSNGAKGPGDEDIDPELEPADVALVGA